MSTIDRVCYQAEPSFEVPLQNFRLNGDQSVAVSTEVFWNEDMVSAPRGVKLQLLGQGGVAHYGIYDGKSTFWKAWAPVPRKRPV